MAEGKDNWKSNEVERFIWERLCKTASGRFNFAPLLQDQEKKSPSGPEFAEAIDRMKVQEYVTDSRPDLQHYWVKLTDSGEKKCKKMF